MVTNQLNVRINKYVLIDLKQSSDSAVLMQDGRTFHRTGAALLKARSPQEERDMGSRSKWLSVADLIEGEMGGMVLEARRYSWVQVHAESCTLGRSTLY